MASKSKKRRRVLGASCILAALIIAGSSFAWFTSKDEVTNRLTASSDYGVSIVESFVPPANWIPGQTINKDVYSVNTGSIAAFVKEDVSAKLTYTYEDIVDNFDPANCVELPIEKARAIDAATTHEAGGFLAWTDAQVDGDTIFSYDIGDKTGLTIDAFTAGTYDARNQDSTESPKEHITFSYMYEDGTGKKYYAKTLNDNETFYRVHTYAGADVVFTTTNTNLNLVLSTNESVDGTTTYALGPVNSARLEDNIPETWAPPADGIYIFRRSIKTEDGVTSFTYAGYRYENGKYYKIVLGNDVYPSTSAGAPNTMVYDVYAEQASLNVDVDEDGRLLEAPVVRYVVENKVENVTPILTYTPGAEGENDFLRVLYSEDQGTNDKIADKQKTYEDALAALEAAKLADSEASADLAQKEAEYRNAQGAYNSAKSRYDQTLADYTYGKALTDATNELVAAAKEKADADAAVKKAVDDFNAAASDLSQEATTQKGTLVDDLWSVWTSTEADQDTNITPTADGLIPENVRQYIDENGVANTPGVDNGYDAGNSSLINAKNNLYAMDVLWGDSDDTAEDDTIYGYYNTITANYQKLTEVPHNIDNTVPSDDNPHSDEVGDDYKPEKVKEYYNNIKTNMAKLISALNNYKALYVGFVDAVEGGNVPENLLSGLNTGNEAASRLENVVSNLTDLYSEDEDHNVVTVLKDLVDKYAEAYKALTDAEEVASDEAGDWTEAIETYNETVAAAKQTYEGNKGIGAEQTLPNDFAYITRVNTAADGDEPVYKYYLTNYGTSDDTALNYVQGAFSVPADSEYSVDYSAVGGSVESKTDDVSDPEIKTNTAYSNYVSVNGSAEADGTYDVTTHLKRNIKAKDDFTQVQPNYADSEQPDDDSVAQTLSALAGKKTDAEDAMNTAEGAFTTAEGTKESTAADKHSKERAVTAAEDDLDNISDAATIDIKVYLDEEWDEYWTIDPVDVAGSDVVDFYLNKILEPGETSHKLIDSVKMADEMSSKDYKDLTFDLNVGLDSIQVTYDANQRDYTADAVNAADDTFRLDATVGDNNSDVTWAP